MSTAKDGMKRHQSQHQTKTHWQSVTFLQSVCHHYTKTIKLFGCCKNTINFDLHTSFSSCLHQNQKTMLCICFYPIIPIHSDLLEIGELIILMNCFSSHYNKTTLHSYKTICAKFSYCCAVVYLYYSQLIIGAYSGTVKAHLCGTYIHDQFSDMICICTAFCFYL